MKSLIVTVILSLSVVACGGGDENSPSLASLSSESVTPPVTPRPDFINKFPAGENFVEPLEMLIGKHQGLSQPSKESDSVPWPSSELYNSIRGSRAGQKKDPLVRRYSSPIHSRSIVSSPTSPVSNSALNMVQFSTREGSGNSIESNRAGQQVEPLIRRCPLPSNPRSIPSSPVSPPSNFRHSMDQSLMKRNSASWPSEVYIPLAKNYACPKKEALVKRYSLPVSVAAASSISSTLAIVTDINQLSMSENWVESPKSSSNRLEHKISNLGISYNDLKSKVFSGLSSDFSLFLCLDTYCLYADDSNEEVKLKIYFNRLSESDFCEKKFLRLSEDNITKDEIINTERVVLLTNFDIASENLENFQKKEDESYFLIVFRRFEGNKKWYKYAIVGDQPSWEEIEDNHFEHWFETGAQFVYFTSDELKTVREEEQAPHLEKVQEEGME
ncbi:hypothetical protein KMZ15_02800 [Mycoavidus sp. HKI]|uniref:hypothetical protein n=1 Tax=Mycoavidus sp. HKI TaxID=2840467 RepID=UPI001CBCBBD0|nr:hypothetical protein [Mycoavidus sp. HKI]UAW64625.1 hypothetical protein KMZ15_02800 [Mycoavidus sp. HKI]